jgi:hypothetical protein
MYRHPSRRRPDGQLIDDTGHTMRFSGNGYDSDDAVTSVARSSRLGHLTRRRVTQLTLCVEPMLEIVSRLASARLEQLVCASGHIVV